jgi:hypothetical protein
MCCCAKEAGGETTQASTKHEAITSLLSLLIGQQWERSGKGFPADRRRGKFPAKKT